MEFDHRCTQDRPPHEDEDSTMWGKTGKRLPKPSMDEARYMQQTITAQSRDQPCRHLDLRRQASRPLDNKFLLALSYGSSRKLIYRSKRILPMDHRLFLGGSKKQAIEDRKAIWKPDRQLLPCQPQTHFTNKETKAWRSHWTTWSELRVQVRSWDYYFPILDFHAQVIFVIFLHMYLL